MNAGTPYHFKNNKKVNLTLDFLLAIDK